MMSQGLMRRISLYLMAALYFFAGLNHLRVPEMYEQMMPAYLPLPYFLVILSGVFESSLGVALLWKPLQKWAAWGVIALLIAVFPANLYMYQRHAELFQNIPSWLLLARLPLQIVLLWWAYGFAKKV